LDHLENLQPEDSILQDQQSTDRFEKLSTKKGSKDIPALSIDATNMGGSPNQLSKAFKMANLSYNPSKVNYRQNVMQRAQLMEMRKTLLEKCEEVIE